jgi:hypothetical protein
MIYIGVLPAFLISPFAEEVIQLLNSQSAKNTAGG